MSATWAVPVTVMILAAGQLALFGLSLLAHLKWKVPIEALVQLLRASVVTRAIAWPNRRLRWLGAEDAETVSAAAHESSGCPCGSHLCRK
jgi:hypothetical protein